MQNSNVDPLMVAVVTYHQGVERDGLGPREAMRRALETAGFIADAQQTEALEDRIAEIRRRVDQIQPLLAA